MDVSIGANFHPVMLCSELFVFQSGGCDFWEWYEDNMTTPFIAELLVDLRDVARKLKKENKDLKAQIGEAHARANAQIEVEGQFAVQVARNADLVGRVNKLEKERVVFMFVILVCGDGDRVNL